MGVPDLYLEDIGLVFLFYSGFWIEIDGFGVRVILGFNFCVKYWDFTRFCGIFEMVTLV